MHRKGLHIGFVLAMVLCAVSLHGQSLTGQSSTSSQTSQSQTTISLQSSISKSASSEISPLIAMSSKDYLVTAGDVYSLSFAQGTKSVIYQISVDTTYKIKVANLATLNVRGKTYVEVKEQVEQIVSNNIPMSGVQFILTTPGQFRVRVQGEVTSTAEPSAWGLTRLYDVIQEYMTPYASIRNVQVTDAAGKTRTYDLFKAQRDGDMKENPHVRPGDVITLNRYSRKVTLSGAVERGGSTNTATVDGIYNSNTATVDGIYNSKTATVDGIYAAGTTELDGTYELLDGENLKELISIYGGGYTDFADRDFAEVQRLKAGADEGEGQYEAIYLHSRSEIESFELMNNDRVTIRSIADQRPVVFVEGAIYGAETEVNSSGLVQPANSTVAPIRFSPGENYTYFIRNNSKMFADVADLEKVYIARGGQTISIDAHKIIYDYTYTVDEQLQSNDRLVVPFRQYFVSVAGAVVTPGRYPYLPDRDWEYYIGLAGGFVPNRNSREKVKIVDMYGKKHRKKDPITPETTITAASNSFTYYFSNYSSVITVILSAISTTLTIYIAAQSL